MTGEVFGAAQTKIHKDEDVTRIINSAVSSATWPTSTNQASHHTNKPIATKDIGSLRVTLKSVLRVGDSDRVRWTFTFENREARKQIAVAMNAVDEEERAGGGVSFGSPSRLIPLRSSVVDDRGGSWELSSTGLGGIDFVRVGVRGRDGRETYSPVEIARLLRLRDELRRETDHPADGVTAQADSMGEGGSNVTFGGGRNTSPVKFFPYRGNRFVSGALTLIEPAQSTAVTMDFRLERNTPSSGSGPSVFQFNSEIVVGVGDKDALKSYSLHNLTFDRISVP
jgi:hypothetical protein